MRLCVPPNTEIAAGIHISADTIKADMKALGEASDPGDTGLCIKRAKLVEQGAEACRARAGVAVDEPWWPYVAPQFDCVEAGQPETALAAPSPE